MRVYELAKQINMSNKELLERFRSLGFEVKSHSSSVDDGAIRALYDSLDEDKGSSQDKGGAAKKPAAKAKSESAESKPEKAPEKKPKMDARAIALQKIQEAKLKRQRAHREALEAEKQKPAAPEEPATEASSEDLKPQEIDLSGAPHVKTGEKPVAEQSPKPKPEAAPAQPKVEAKKPAQAPQPAKPPQAPRQERKPEPKPQQQRRNKPIPDLRNRTVELEQLPSLPKRTPPRHERQQRDKDKPLDLTVPPSIEVMKMKPSRKPTKRQKEEDERNRKKGLKTSKQQGEKKIRPGRFLNIDSIEETVGAKEGKRAVRPRSKVLSGVKEQKEEAVAPKPQMPKAIKIYGDITLGELAEKLNIQATDLIAKAMELGEMLNINKLVSTDLIELLASEFEVEIEVVPENDETDVEKYLVTDEKEEELKSRPPVVTIMGHVDHGKTTLLDTIRKTNVAEGEFGGITQHIGAYHVETDRGEIVFLDTPGHEAFTAMRARGASVTDIVILIVAADDSLMPQTIEAINHSRAAKVPIIVAINKVDLPAANVQKVRNDLMQHSLISEDLGGDTIICEVSAKRGDGIDHLLEMVLLQAEVMELKANPKGLAQGIVIESEIDPQRGTSATILIKRGTLKQGAPFVCGDVSGRVRLMRDDLNKEVEEATPSHPVEILGLDGCPQVGEMFIELESEREARQIASVREGRRRRQTQNAAMKPHVTMEGLAEYLDQEGVSKELNIILKADVQGSVEAVTQSMLRLSTEKVTINVIHSGVGAVTESDVQLAMASDAIVIGFNVRPDSSATELANSEGIDIKTYRVIYQLLEELQAAMVGMLDKKYKEVAKGKAEIRQVFRVSRLGNIAGCYVTEGTVSRSDKIRLVRDGVVVHEGSIQTLRRVKDDVSSVQAGYECGLTLRDYQDIKEGDVVETYVHEEVAQTL